MEIANTVVGGVTPSTEAFGDSPSEGSSPNAARGDHNHGMPANPVPGAWTPYTPALLNITLGNGSVTAAYVVIGKTVHVRINLLFGTTTTIDATPTRISIPILPTDMFIAPGMIYRSSLGTFHQIVGLFDLGSNILQLSPAVGSLTDELTFISATFPVTFLAGDHLIFDMTYEST